MKVLVSLWKARESRGHILQRQLQAVMRPHMSLKQCCRTAPAWDVSEGLPDTLKILSRNTSPLCGRNVHVLLNLEVALYLPLVIDM